MIQTCVSREMVLKCILGFAQSRFNLRSNPVDILRLDSIDSGMAKNMIV